MKPYSNVMKPYIKKQARSFGQGEMVNEKLNTLQQRVTTSRLDSSRYVRRTSNQVFGFSATMIFMLGFIISVNSAKSFSSSNHNLVVRSLSSLNFPVKRTQSDIEDILEEYQSYLDFVLEIGSQVDNSRSQKLASLFKSLKLRSPKNAALFLKGLRFEMNQKVDLMNVSSERLTSHSKEMRQFIAKYLKDWVREADEYLFRAKITANAELAKAE